MKQLPIKTCPACGGSWFREVTLLQFWDRKDLFRFPDQSRASRMPMTILICLCGTPFRPTLGGIRGGYTPNAELIEFYRSFDCVQKQEVLCQDRSALERIVAEDLVPKDSRQEIQRMIVGAEKKISRCLAPRDDANAKRGGLWRLSKRDRASKGKGRDWLALQLQNAGFTFDEARETVSAIVDSMTDALKAGESVDTPLGQFHVVERTKPYRRFRLHKLQKLHRVRKKVVFKRG